MQKDDEKQDLVHEEEQPSSGSSSSAPGILFSSMTELRGFPMSPNGTALGVGGPRPVAPDEGTLPPPKTDVTPESFARIQKMLGRLDDDFPRRRGSAIDTSDINDNGGNEPEPPRAPQATYSDAPQVRRDACAPSSGAALSLETREQGSSGERDFAEGPSSSTERVGATSRRTLERRKWLALLCLACAAALGLVALGRITATVAHEERTSAASAPPPALLTSATPPVEQARPAPEPTVSAQPVVSPKPVESPVVVHPSNASARHVTPPNASPSVSPMLPSPVASAPAPPAVAPVVSSKPGPHNQQITDFTSKPSNPSE